MSVERESFRLLHLQSHRVDLFILTVEALVLPI
jgi:hypothetical protein